MNTPDKDANVDFAILTALKVERDAILKRVKGVSRIEAPNDPYVYYRGEMEIVGTTKVYQVVVTCFLAAGNVEAGVQTAALLSRWRPNHVLMVGICGGFTEKGVARGDVLVANFIYYYEPGKVRDAGEERRARQFECDTILRAKATNYEAVDWKGEVYAPLPSGMDNYVSRAHVGPIACGEQVISAQSRIDELLRECPQLLGVAMEGAGVATAVANGGLSFLEIRGCSDEANKTKNDEWHIYAANAAAAFTAGFLRSHPIWSIEEVAERGSMRATPEVSTLTILRAQSLRAIGPQEVVEVFPPELKDRELKTVALDFTDLMSADRRLSDPENAARRLGEPDGPLLSALSSHDAGEFIFHGLIHIPLAVLAGFIVSDRQKVRLFDFHPVPGEETWRWPGKGETFPLLHATGIPIEKLPDAGSVIIRVSVSYPADVAESRRSVPDAKIEVDLALEDPERGVVRSEEQVRVYGAAFRKVLDAVSNRVPNCDRIHLFYAGPVSLAFHLGQQLSENIHPPLVVWNFRRDEGYAWGIDLRSACRAEPSVVLPASA